MQKGTPINARVTGIRKSKGKYLVECCPDVDESYDSKLFISKPLSSEPQCGLGSIVKVYVDEIDCDGQYYVSV